MKKKSCFGNKKLESNGSKKEIKILNFSMQLPLKEGRGIR